VIVNDQRAQDKCSLIQVYARDSRRDVTMTVILTQVDACANNLAFSVLDYPGEGWSVQ